jgi:hypothetical protein
MCSEYCADEALQKFAFQVCQLHPFVKQQFANLKPFAIDLSNLQKGFNQSYTLYFVQNLNNLRYFR